jgi:hypothetical protein
MLPEDGVVVQLDVALVVHLDQHVGVALVEQPVRGRVGRRDDGRLVAQALVLSEVEVADDDDHSQVVRAIEHALEPRKVLGPQVTGGCEG